MGNGAGRIGLIAAVAGFSLAAVAADFDVRAFGVKGDGEAKDTGAIVRLTFDDCDFKVVSDSELPGYHRHGAADWCRRHGDTNRFAEIR